MTASRLLLKHAEFLHLVRNHGGRGSLMQFRYVNDKFAEIVFANAAKKNCITGTMMYQLAEIVDQLESDLLSSHKPLCLLIRGEGNDTFSSGADLSLVSDLINSPERGAMMYHFMSDALNRIRNSAAISACAINGLALGGGSELTTIGDFRLMTNDPKHYISFFHAKIGAMPGWGGIHRLVSIVGRKNAIKLCGGSSKVFAEEAMKIGLVDKIVDIRSDDDWQIVAQEYFQPYLDQKYHKSVLAMKEVIAAADVGDEEYAKIAELNGFKKRWYVDDHAKFMNDRLLKQ